MVEANTETRSPGAPLRAIAAAVKPGAGWADHCAAARRLDAVASAVPAALRVRVAVVGSFTLEPLVPFLRIAGARAGVWLDMHVGAYGQYASELLDPRSPLAAFAPQVTFVAIGSDAIAEMRWAQDTPPSADATAAALVGALGEAIDGYRAHGTGIVVVNDFPSPHADVAGVQSARIASSLARTVACANERLVAAAASRPDTYVFPLTDLVARIGRDAAFDRRTHYRGHVTWSDALMRAVAERYAGIAAATIGRGTKCIVLDLDDTLWGGILGEAGAAGIAIGAQAPGREFLDFQRQLVELNRMGILLAVSSKNDEPDALQVLREHPDMVIRERHLAAHRINWQDKATNIRELAQELNIGLEQMLFIDDSPHERAWVRDQLPALVVPDPPADPAQLADWLPTLPSLVVLQQTAEDARRTDQYREAGERERFRATVRTPEQFLRALQLRVRIEPVNALSVERVAQLLAKTNQFNLTTRRHDVATLRRRIASGEWRVLTMRVSDRFGDFGLTGIAIAEPGERAWHLESFLMSCRVIGKSVESALLAAVAREARAAGASVLTAEFIDSGRNGPARDLLPQHGFEADGAGRFVRSLDDGGPAWPEWIAGDAERSASPASRGDGRAVG